MKNQSLLNLDIKSVKNAYLQEKMKVVDLIKIIYEKIKNYEDKAVWIYLQPFEETMKRAEELDRIFRDEKDPYSAYPLLGIPFAVKDNIDVFNMPTTAACPQYQYYPKKHAFVVQNLIKAGGIPLGKTNLDQFATGLVGTRSPYGACKNVFNKSYISGGSSSGSAIAVASGMVSFSLGTDTAGSGRVPAAFNNLVGLKPTKGLLSTSGVVPACRSLDCVSVFAQNCEDAGSVLKLAEGFDETDIYSRKPQVKQEKNKSYKNGFKFGVPREDQLKFFENQEYPQLFKEGIKMLKSMGGTEVRIDYSIFQETANLLYYGPWVAERMAGLESFFKSNPDDINPITKKVIARANEVNAVDTFKGEYTLMAYKREAEKIFSTIDCLLLPTAGTIYTHDDLEKEPIQYNTNLGYYTNFVNLLDFSGLALPCGFQKNGLPFGITLIAEAFSESWLLEIGKDFHSTSSLSLTNQNQNQTNINNMAKKEEKFVELAVVGLHLTGQKLNYQLTDLQSSLIKKCKTAPHYKLFAIERIGNLVPGLIKYEEGAGTKIEVEVWKIAENALGSFMQNVSAPLCIGTIELEDGQLVKGFLCESWATKKGKDISSFGGWLKFIRGK